MSDKEIVVKVRDLDGADPSAHIEAHLTERSDQTGTFWIVRIDGVRVGQVRKYRGSLDRRVGRLRQPGKTRDLWSAYPAPTDREKYPHPWSGRLSRAEAIRELAKWAR